MSLFVFILKFEVSAFIHRLLGDCGNFVVAAKSAQFAIELLHCLAISMCEKDSNSGYLLFTVGTYKVTGRQLIHKVLDAAFKSGYRSIGESMGNQEMSLGTYHR